MKSLQSALLFALSCALATPLLAQNQIGGGTCTPSLLNGTYSISFTGSRLSSASATTPATFEGVGAAKFDGQGNVTFTGTAVTTLLVAAPFTFSGTYTLPSNCSGTITLTTSSPGSFSLVVWNNGKTFAFVGSDATYLYSGGGDVPPAACVTATLSGEYLYDATGSTLVSNKQNGAAAETGVLQFDGQGKVTATSTTYSNGASTQTTATGTYSVTPDCQGSATLTDSSNVANTVNFGITSAYGQTVRIIDANPQFLRVGTAHSAFLNPSQAIGNVASYAVNATPPGSVFALFGSNLATKQAGAVTTTLPTKLLSTTVTVNGELAPLFYVDTQQIDAQLPWDIPAGTVATVIVTNGTATSNAVALTVPATGTPGISVYGNNRAVVVNQNGAINSPTAPAAVGDEVVAYFTGGGPVQAAGKLVTGAPAPAGLSPLTENSSITVNNVPATVAYIGLTPGSIGLYQANFFVPQVAKGTYPLVITIGGQPSNSPVITVSN